MKILIFFILALTCRISCFDQNQTSVDILWSKLSSLPSQSSTNYGLVRFGDSNNGIILLDDFLSTEECDNIILISESFIHQSIVDDYETNNNFLSGYRTNSGAYYTLNSFHDIEKRLANLTHLDTSHMEGFKVLKYDTSKQYEPNSDYSDTRYNENDDLLKLKGHRVLTVILYLNDVPCGGHSLFPLLNISITPKKGSALLFPSVSRTNELFINSYHSELPVLNGTKWIATMWFREKSTVQSYIKYDINHQNNIFLCNFFDSVTDNRMELKKWTLLYRNEDEIDKILKLRWDITMNYRSKKQNDQFHPMKTTLHTNNEFINYSNEFSKAEINCNAKMMFIIVEFTLEQERFEIETKYSIKKRF
jgi:hypothetical protein